MDDKHPQTESKPAAEQRAEPTEEKQRKPDPQARAIEAFLAKQRAAMGHT